VPQNSRSRWTEKPGAPQLLTAHFELLHNDVETASREVRLDITLKETLRFAPVLQDCIHVAKGEHELRDLRIQPSCPVTKRESPARTV